MNDDDLSQLRDDVRYLKDRTAIMDVVARHARGHDRHDVDLLTSTYHVDGVDEHGSAINRGPAYAPWANAVHAATTQAHTHNITTHLCEIDGDVANCESYVLVALLAPDTSVVTVMSGRYIDRLERRDGEWKIALRRATVDLAFSADARLLQSPRLQGAGLSEESARRARPVVPAAARSRRAARGDMVTAHPVTVARQARSHMAATRRVGTQTSGTRDLLLDCAERLMVEEGYASVTYRKVAAKAGVTSGLVQYYFPAIDDLFVAGIRRANERNLRQLTEALEARPDDPKRVLWEYSRDEAATSVMLEFMALGNHRKSIRSEIADATNRVREVQLAALTSYWREHGNGEDPSPAAMLFLMTGLPKMIQLEEGFGILAAHEEIVALVERYLDSGVGAPTSATSRMSRRPRSDRVRGPKAERSVRRRLLRRPKWCGGHSSANDRRHRVPTPNRRRRRPMRVRQVDIPIGEPVQHLVEGDPALETRQRRTQAKVHAVSERDVRAVLAVDVETLGIREATLVVIRRRQHQQHGASRRHGLAVELQGLSDVPRDVRARWLDPQQLLHRVRDERAIVQHRTALIGVLSEQFAHPSEQPAGRLDTGTGNDREKDQDLLLRQTTRVTPVESSNSMFSSSVIRSSEGFLIRQSTYSANLSPSK